MKGKDVLKNHDDAKTAFVNYLKRIEMNIKALKESIKNHSEKLEYYEKYYQELFNMSFEEFKEKRPDKN